MLALMQRLGITSRVASSEWRRRRLLILCYHGIARFDEHLWNPNLYISAGDFARRMELLRANRCAVLPLDEAVDRLYRDDLPERAVVLTFDDGYYDFAAAALPTLKAYGFPATVYLPTLRVEHNMPIVGLMLSYILWLCRDRILDGRDIPGAGAEHRLGAIADRDALAKRIIEAANGRRFEKDAKDRLVRTVAARLGLDYDDLLARRIVTLLSPGEVTALARDGVDFQLHTHRHRSPNDAALLAREIAENRERIEALTGRRPSHFCWPSGVYWPDQLATLAAEGVKTATTCDPGIASPTSHRLLLPRFVDTTQVDELAFTSWLGGPAAWMSYRQPAARREAWSRKASAERGAAERTAVSAKASAERTA
jgi:peptidoglycan/xylan/chitin deacetylase (PgdA/CDA1 family)